MERPVFLPEKNTYRFDLNVGRFILGFGFFMGIVIQLTRDRSMGLPLISELNTYIIVLFSLAVLVGSFFNKFVEKNTYQLALIVLFLYGIDACINLFLLGYGPDERTGYLIFTTITVWFFRVRTQLIIFCIFLMAALAAVTIITPEAQEGGLVFFIRYVMVLFGVFLLVSNQIRKNDLLDSESLRKEELIQNLNEGLLQLNEDFKISLVNPQLANMLGYGVEDHIGDFVLNEVTLPEDRPMLAHKLIERSAGKSDRYTLRLLHKDGHIIHAINSVSPRFDSNGNVVGTTNLIVDISETQAKIHQLQKELERREQKLNDLEAKKLELERFAGKISTDLQAPLENINKGILQIQALISTDSEAQNHMEIVENNIGRIYEIMQAVLLFSVTDITQMKPEDLDLNRILEEVKSSLQVSINRNEVELEYENLPMIHADKVQMLRLFRNLIENAIDQRGEENPKIYISYTEDPEKGEFIFSFQDNGAGIRPEDYDNIFRIFQDDQAPEVDKQGFGFGLNICKKIITNHNGRLWFTSNAGKGTTFFFSLPANFKPKEENQLVETESE